MLKQLLSPQKILEQLSAVWRRFPVTVVFVLVCTIYALLDCWEAIKPDARTEYAVWLSLTIGTLLSLAIYQWSEALGKSSRPVLAQTVGIIICCANFFAVISGLVPINTAFVTAYLATYTALAVAVGFLPTISRKGSRQQWSYSTGVFASLCKAVIVAITLAIASAIIYTTIHTLFSVGSWRLYTTMLIIFACALPALLLLSNMPEPNDTDEYIDTYGLGISKFCKNILLPVALVYTAILYFYSLKIILTMSLPQGGVTWMVTGLIMVSLIIIFGLHGFLYSSEAGPMAVRIAKVTCRWMPVVMLPLLVLMSVAIGYRVWEYGITPSRLYVLTFNVWAYAVTAYLWFAKDAALNRVATLFALIFVITSIIPGCNYNTLGMKYIQNKVMTELTAAGVEDMPMSKKQLKDVLKGLPKEKAESLAQDIAYLDDWDDHSLVAPFVKDDETITYYSLMPSSYDDNDFNVNVDEVPLEPIPTGFRSLSYVTKNSYPKVKAKNGCMTIEIEPYDISVPVDSLLRTHGQGPFKPVYINVDTATVFVLCYYQLRGDSVAGCPQYDNVNIRGYLLKR